mmetsp:Transcript_112138/g.216028  ORF Transcript_112138/g.216028 Transcript_112138/m.216028 type:complete len:888 (+) Transcript_112138:157-2820(+)
MAGDLEDPFTPTLERSTIAQTLKAARASLAEPSRPFTPLDRSLFQYGDGSPSRPNSSYSVDQLAFVRDTFGGRPESARSSRSSRMSGRPEAIAEEGSADVLILDEDEPRRFGSSEVGDGGSSGSEEITPVTASSAAAPAPPSRGPARPPRPPTGGYPAGAAAATTLRQTGSGGYPQSMPDPPLASDASPRKHNRSSSGRRRKSGEESPSTPSRKSRESSRSRRKNASSPGGAAASDAEAWEASCEALIAKLQAMAESEEKRRKSEERLLEMSDSIWKLIEDMKAGKASKAQQFAPKLLRAVLGLMDLKDAKCLLKLSRCALVLLQLEGAVQGVHASGVQAAYLNVAKVLFKCSKSEGHDGEFLQEGLLGPLLEVLQSTAPECASNDLRVYIVGVLKNISHDHANQKFLVEQKAIDSLFGLTSSDQLTGSSKEAQLLIQVTATLRNLATFPDRDARVHRIFLQEERLNSMTRMMALFPGHVELLTNISRILSKLTLHNSTCEALAKSDVHLRQLARTMSANADCAPLTLRLGFVLGNLTARSDRLRLVFGFDCEGTALVPQLLQRYWQKDRQLARLEVEKSGKAAGAQELEEVLVKLVRLLANIAISASAGSTLASSSAVVDPLLDMLGAKRISSSEELVLNVVSTITNLSFYDVPSNLLFEEENKQLLCRLFRPLLLESYNDEALVETTRALGNLSRDAVARRCMAELRLDEILVILLSHYHRDLVYYVCGVLVNLASDPECSMRLTAESPVGQKLGELLRDADDTALRLVAVKVLTNLSLVDIQWSESDLQCLRNGLEPLTAAVEEHAEDAADRLQLAELAQKLLERLPEPAGANGPSSAVCEVVGGSAAGADGFFYCQVPGCGRRFDSEEKLTKHRDRRHSQEAR